MGRAAFLCCLVFVNISYAQVRSHSKVSHSYNRNSRAITPDSLSRFLTAGINTEHDKVVAIFRWITENISYNTNKNPRPYAVDYLEDDLEEDNDAVTELRPLDERVARKVLERGSAVCDGYSRLFKTLCTYAGIEAKIITGYARSNSGRQRPFTSNHRWNAVRINGGWHLLDVTWASGYTTYFSNEFIKAYDPSYFLTPPRVLARDHFPEDVEWTLLPDPPVYKEFDQGPFKYSSLQQFNLSSFAPACGIVEASVGDTLSFYVEGAATERLLRISNSPLVDSNLFYNDEAWKFPRPHGTVFTKKATARYVVDTTRDEWLYVILNEEIIFRYRLTIKNPKSLLAGTGN
jgi:hypothetical protein